MMFITDITAVIDIGSNSVKITVYDKDLRIIYQSSVASRLASGFTADEKFLQPEPVICTINAINLFIAKANEFGCGKIYILATEAVRRAENKDWFVNLVKEAAGVELTVLSSEDEAKLACIAASDESGFKDFVMMDTGGGSTEFVYVKNGKVIDNISFPWGGVTLNSTFASDVSVTYDEFISAVSYVSDGLSSVSWLSGTVGLPIVALGGTLRVYKKFSSDYSPSEFVSKIINMNIDERINMGIPADRADIMPVGMVPLVVLSSIIKSDIIKICESGIRDGFIISLANSC